MGDIGQEVAHYEVLPLVGEEPTPVHAVPTSPSEPELDAEPQPDPDPAR